MLQDGYGIGYFGAVLPLLESEQTKNLLGRIVSQHDQLLAGINVQEQFAGTKRIEDRLVAAEHIINELKVVLGDVKPFQMPQGQGLIIRTAPNTFRVTFPVPMRISPNVTFRNVPTGSTPNIIEKSTVGLTVIFTPPTIPVKTLPPMEASADL